MKVEQLSLKDATWEGSLSEIKFIPNIFLLFISPLFKEKRALVDKILECYPNATILGCSTAGEISGISVSDKTVSLTAIKLEKVNHKLVKEHVTSMTDSSNAGMALANQLNAKDLKHVIVFSDGLNVNGAELVSGLKSVLKDVSITGGLAGDCSEFKETFVVANNTITDKLIVGLGFYGDQLNVGFSSKGGWDSFGIDRLVTKSNNNILYELDGLPALELYKSYLGHNAKNLPSSGLLFPLSMRVNEHDTPVVRTILGINEADQSLTFAGNIPEGSYVRLMKANVDRLISGAEDSARNANDSTNGGTELAILISCVGRRLVLKQLVEEEVEVVQDIIGKAPKITGFYSYGEIAPFSLFSPCELHNQTMTITTLSE
ncbi:FIST signal transduction protein [Winogradskyella bathintestinalis]|uniref:FIST C-terminal domain-containing protein n=1 Tax=Winogradskyella bathintestinalis TaxID=3035208 RepID=A0ABT7ZX55_9FLAO|nr:FIST N-terminal domain-containing protein [Winogradskyella bathintestinalis]MDN3493567.1 FIST C-terminal domain-containing protein [Winogradskyella bathintestinalis]